MLALPLAERSVPTGRLARACALLDRARWLVQRGILDREAWLLAGEAVLVAEGGAAEGGCRPKPPRGRGV